MIYNHIGSERGMSGKGSSKQQSDIFVWQLTEFAL